MIRSTGTALLVLLFVAPSTLLSQELEPFTDDEARNIATRLVGLAAEIEEPQIKISADIAQANGVHVPRELGLLVVPQQGLKESEELAAKFKTELGAPIGYLFAYRVVPIADGDAVESEKLRTLKMQTDDGEAFEVNVYLLAVRQLAAGDYRLHAHGSGKQPVVNASFAPATALGSETVTVEINDVDSDKRQGTAVVTVFGKFQASFRVGHEG